MRRWCFPHKTTRGTPFSTIAEERAYNPRLQVKSAEGYAALMNGLNLANPKMMDVAVPANMHQEDVAHHGWAYSAQQALDLVGQPDVVLIDLREKAERRGTDASRDLCTRRIPSCRRTSAMEAYYRSWQR